MQIIHFHIHYYTKPGEELFVSYQFLGQNQKQNRGEKHGRLILRSYDGAHWIGTMPLEQGSNLAYQYGVQNMIGDQMESGPQRTLPVTTSHKNIFLNDYWRLKQSQNQIFLSSAFRDVILKRSIRKKSKRKQDQPGLPNQIRFHLLAADIDPSYTVGVIGDSDILGNWTTPILLDDASYPLWKNQVLVPGMKGQVEYKFVICQADSKEIIAWESGANRTLDYNFPEASGNVCQVTDEGFRHMSPWWRGAGVAIPIFSLRSRRSFGIGEFSDLLPLADMSQKAGMKIIQVLPVNDTIATKTWKDSYPYAAISVYALHPLYINIEKIAEFDKQKDKKSYTRDQKKLNAFEQIDFEQVLQLKMKYLHILYDREKGKTLKSNAYKKFVRQNKEWLLPYAAFAHLRDINGTPDFNRWENHAQFQPKVIKELTDPKSSSYDEIHFYIFQQYHADKQLKEAKKYAADLGIVLKGDLPIGIYRYSCDAWVAPELYHMEEQAGAPPDDYSELGQNWGFPTYNWEEMGKDGFRWWQERMKKLSQYFDALRIDHILGFFRIWQVPMDQVQGTMGMFNPRLPYHLHDLYRYGIEGNMERYSKPFIRDYFLHELFGDDTELVIQKFLNDLGRGHFELKDIVSTQAKIKAHFLEEENGVYQHLVTPLFRLVSEVLLIEEPGSEWTSFNPRITLQKTFSYQALNEDEKRLFDALYHEYYYTRHEAFWKQQAVWKLPALLDATNMLICGEDLGMIPASVPGVMKDLNIIPLEIQRMPKGSTKFGIPAQYPYLSVCSPSCHDMSTIRGWWEGDYELAKSFYHDHLHISGQAPRLCAPDLVEIINREHLHAPSILAIFPIQDLLGMDDTLKKEDPFSEQINEPSNPDHYWRYRLHLNLEDLVEEEEILLKIKQLVKNSGRNIRSN